MQVVAPCLTNEAFYLNLIRLRSTAHRTGVSVVRPDSRTQANPRIRSHRQLPDQELRQVIRRVLSQATRPKLEYDLAETLG